jgi:L-malate glycosyltransferase
MSQNYNNQQHILILSNGYPSVYQTLSGSFWKDQAETLVNQNCKVGLIATTPISLKDIKRKGVMNLRSKTKIENGVYTSVIRFPNVPFFNFLESFFSVFFGFYLFKKYIRKNGLPDVIHVHRYEVGLLAIKLKREYNIPYVVTEHSSRFLYETMSKKEISIARKVFLHANVCIAVSKSLANKLSESFDIKFNYIPNIVSTEFFKKNENTQKNKLFSFFCAGNLDVNKNHKMLIEAFYLFQKEYPNSLLYIAGEGPQKLSLRSQIEKLRLLESVILLGKLNRDDMVKFNNKCHVFVLPSFKETFGVVLIEALSTGIPVISTNSGGPSSIIIDERIGEVCENNSEALSNAMKKVYINFDTYSSDWIIKYVNENFSKEKVISKLMKMYHDLIRINERK